MSLNQEDDYGDEDFRNFTKNAKPLIIDVGPLEIKRSDWIRIEIRMLQDRIKKLEHDLHAALLAND